MINKIDNTDSLVKAIIALGAHIFSSCVILAMQIVETPSAHQSHDEWLVSLIVSSEPFYQIKYTDLNGALRSLLSKLSTVLHAKLEEGQCLVQQYLLEEAPHDTVENERTS